MRELIGAKVIKVRKMTKREIKSYGWEGLGNNLVIEFDNGYSLIPSSDEEGNSPGTLFAQDQDGKQFYVEVQD